MKNLSRMSNGLQKFATRQYMLPLFILFLLILAVMEFSPISTRALKILGGGKGMLDMQFGYSQSLFSSHLTTLGETGRLLYTRLLGVDVLLVLTMMALQSLLITVLVQKNGLAPRWKVLNLLPFVRALFDILENGLLFILIQAFPTQLPVLTTAASSATVLKWIVFVLMMVVTFSLGALLSTQNIRAQMKLKIARKES